MDPAGEGFEEHNGAILPLEEDDVNNWEAQLRAIFLDIYIRIDGYVKEWSESF